MSIFSLITAPIVWLEQSLLFYSQSRTFTKVLFVYVCNLFVLTLRILNEAILWSTLMIPYHFFKTLGITIITVSKSLSQIEFLFLLIGLVTGNKNYCINKWMYNNTVISGLWAATFFTSFVAYTSKYLLHKYGNSILKQFQLILYMYKVDPAYIQVHAIV